MRGFASACLFVFLGAAIAERPGGEGQAPAQAQGPVRWPYPTFPS
jgi:hypothetical protein